MKLPFFEEIKAKNAQWKEKEIGKLIKGSRTILDYGCGDLLFAAKLKKKNKSLQITGVDVVDSVPPKGIRFIKYGGRKLPFKDNSFDVVLSVYVFHHCRNAESALRECVRVAKKKVVFIEAIARNNAEIPPMKFMDWFFNVWKPEPIPLTFQFKALQEWERLFKKFSLRVATKKEIKNPIAILPIGKAYIFMLEKKKSSSISLTNTKKRKKTKVYIGGTFDLFHNGHIALMKYAKSIADEVVVSLNTDEFSLQYKGRRPVMTLEERIAVVSACKYVDKVDINEGGYDSKPAILRNKPDYILHGSDSVGGGELKRLMISKTFLKRHKIKMIYFPLVKGMSTTELRRRTKSKSRRQDKTIREIKTPLMQQ